jgi:hypothetical protein
MADEKLVSTLTAYINSGLSEQQAREKLMAAGWTQEDVNGAFGIHALSHKPIGSNLISSWTERKASEGKKETHYIVTALFFIFAIGFFVIVADWYGYQLPHMQQYQIKNFVSERLNIQTTPTDTEVTPSP